MNNCIWLYWLLICAFAVIPFVMLYVEYRTHKTLKQALCCPVWYGMTISSIVSCSVAIYFYPDGMGMVSIFIFGLGGLFSFTVAELMNSRRLRDAIP